MVKPPPLDHADSVTFSDSSRNFAAKHFKSHVVHDLEVLKLSLIDVYKELLNLVAEILFVVDIGGQGFLHCLLPPFEITFQISYKIDLINDTLVFELNRFH